MVSLGNQARLLAAQAFNKQVIERKARERQAKIESERREDLAKITRRKAEQVASARNVVERQRAQEALNEQLRSKETRDRQAKINAEAKRKSAKAFTRVAKGANIGVLTGFEAKKDTRGRTIGISTRQSKTRKRTITLLKTEIARQQKIAREGTDLERFLSNEQAINQGRVSRSQLNKQIADRKRRGLSKTPAQKRASQFFRDQEFSTALDRRSARKGKPKQRATFGTAVSERARAQQLGSEPFADPLFSFGGRTRAEQVSRGGTFGRRAGGESISSQLSFISQAKSRSTSQRIGFAQGLLSNLNFEGSSQGSLLQIVGNKRIKTPKTFQATLREGVGFFTTEAIPVTKAKLTKGERGLKVARRKAEDFAKTEKARKTIARQARTTRQPVFDLAGFGRELDVANLARGRAIEAQERPTRFSLTPPTVQRQQAQPPTPISLLDPRAPIGQPTVAESIIGDIRSQQAIFGGELGEGVTARDLLSQRATSLIPTVRAGQLTPAEKKREAKARQDETDLIRGTPFQVGELVPATGVAGTRTETFFPEIPSGEVFDVNLSESIGISDIFSPTPAPTKKAKGKKGKPSPTQQQVGGFGILDISSLIAFDAPARQRVTTKPKQPAPPRETVGILDDFFALGDTFGSQSAGATFTLGEAVESSILFEPFR